MCNNLLFTSRRNRHLILGTYIEDITRWCKQMKFIFEWKKYFTSKHRTFSSKSRTFSINKNLNALHIFSKQTLLFGFTELADPDNKKQPMTGHLGQKSGLAKSQFLFYSAVVSKVF